MRKPFVGETVALRAEFFYPDGSALPATGVTFAVQRADGTGRLVVDGEATAQAHVWTGLVPVGTRGAWEAQAHCDGPVEAYSQRERFEVVAPLDFSPP
jgi:hypothetical protein